MGQDHSRQHHRKPSQDGETHLDDVEVPQARKAPVTLPPVVPAANHSVNQSFDSHTTDKPEWNLSEARRVVDRHPVADDPVIPFHKAELAAAEQNGGTAAAATAVPVRTPTPPPHESKPVNPHVSRPINPHRRALPSNVATSAAEIATELPPIVQIHRASRPSSQPVSGPASQPSSLAPLSQPEPKTFTEAEIKAILAIDASRVIVFIKGNVYDVTKFVDAHPGGASVLRRNNGKDITETFFTIHGPHTAERLPQFLMGRLVAEEERHPPAATAAAADAADPSKPLSMDSIRRMLAENPKRVILILFGDAYDVTEMCSSHPGGKLVLLNNNGKECGDVFMRVHGLRAKKDVHQYLMGRVPELGDAPSPLLRFAEPNTEGSAKGSGGKLVNPRAQSTRILEKEMLNAAGTLQAFTFSCPKPLRLIPGGHVKLFSDVQRDEWQYYTPFQTEIASFKICIKLYKGGRTSNYLFNQPEGAEVFYEGPFRPSWELQLDSFVTTMKADKRHILLLAGGTGIAPLYSIMAHELTKQTTSVTLVFSVHTPDDLMLMDEINRLVVRYAKPLPDQLHTLRVALVFSRSPQHGPVPETPLEFTALVRCGTHVDADFLTALELPPTQAAVICGPPAFNDAVASAVLQAGVCPAECVHSL